MKPFVESDVTVISKNYETDKEIELTARLSDLFPIPHQVRKFGKPLNPDLLQAGDLILTCSGKPTFFGKLITKHQGKMFSPEHAKWQHAVVSGGRFEICEADTSGVTAKEYWAYMNGDYQLKVRRLKGADEATRNKIAYYAATHVGTKYSFLNAVNLRSFLGGTDAWQRPGIRSSGIICSQLYFEACMRVGYLLANVRPEAVCPAHLSTSTLLEDVKVNWVDV